ncbi:MAG: glutaredoxin domain-containing protein [Minisyncoccota bacterium]
MLILYWRPTCPFCHKVLDTAERLGLSLEKRDIADPKIAAELVRKGGKQQVPYLIDTARNVEMYESMDIDAYLREHYA